MSGVRIGSVYYPREIWNEMQRDAAPDKKEQDEMRSQGRITDWNNFVYPFNLWGWTRTNINQVHIERQNEPGRTLCGISTAGWGGYADPEPENPKEDKCYASCKRCIKVFNKLRVSTPMRSSSSKKQ